jgi:hypothetical protein
MPGHTPGFIAIAAVIWPEQIYSHSNYIVRAIIWFELLYGLSYYMIVYIRGCYIINSDVIRDIMGST